MMKNVKDEEIKELVQQYNDSGWVAFIYPRKKLVALNGARSISYQEAKYKIKAALLKAKI